MLVGEEEGNRAPPPGQRQSLILRNVWSDPFSSLHNSRSFTLFPSPPLVPNYDVPSPVSEPIAG